MGGLVLGITVNPAPDWAPADAVPRRSLRLHIGSRAGVFGDEPGYGFVLQEGATPPAPDSVRFPGSPIVLTRGEPTEITVLNHADVPLGVHWHGLELESWADGVPGWSGSPGRVSPAIQPGDSFVVRMTPPRAGTFMYHVHSEPGHQLAQGLYGPFLVLEPGERWEPETGRVFLLGSLGTGEDPPPAVDGKLQPELIELHAGESYRLRFMHISPDDDKQVELLAGDEPVEWQLIAKDGADLPSQQIRTQPADLRIHVGETYDYRWVPEEGEYVLRITTTFDRGAPAFPRDAPEPHVAEIPVRVGVHSAAQELTGAAADSAAVVETLERFIHAFNDLDWAMFRDHFADDATVFFPMSSNRMRGDGRAEVEAVFGALFRSPRAPDGGPPYLSIRPLDAKIQMLSNAAVATFHLGADDEPSVGRRTLVLRRDGDGEWRIVHLHASVIDRD